MTLLGRNGAGRTTTLQRHPRAHRPRAPARSRINGQRDDQHAAAPDRRLGIGYCPEERGIFSSLSAEENLMLPPAVGARAA